MGMLFEVIARVRRRLLLNVITTQSAYAMNGFLGMLVLITLFGTDALEWQWLAIPPLIIATAGGWDTWRRFPNRYRAAQLLDNRLGLADALSTAVFFSSPRVRRCDESMLQAHCEIASRIAADVNPREAVPLKIPRAALWSVLIAALAAGLITMRYRIEGRIDLRRPMVPGVQQLAQLVRQEVEAAQKTLSARTDDLSSQENDSLKSEKASGNSRQKSSASAAMQPVQRPGAAAKNALGNEGESDSAADGDQNPGEGGQQENSSNNEGKPNMGGRDSAGRSGTQQQQSAAAAANESSSIFNKINNSVSNLLSAVKPHSGPAGKNAADSAHGGKARSGKNGKTGSGQDQTSSASDSLERGEASNSEQGDPARGAAAGQNADGEPGKLAGSGAGTSEGEKAIRKAEQRAAMGKLSMILGRRAENLTGTTAVEVLHGEQELITRYQDKKSDHRDVHAKGERDEVPLELQSYVDRYFARLHESGAGTADTKKK